MSQLFRNSPLDESIGSLLDEVRYPKEFPQDVLNQLIVRSSESVPYLLNHVQDPEHAYYLDLACGDSTPFICLYLLAYLREPKACPAMLDLLRFQNDDFHEFWGDILFEDMPRILYSVYDGNIQALVDFVFDASAHDHARAVVLDTLGILSGFGEIDAKVLPDTLRRLYTLDVNDENHFVMVSFVCLVRDIQLHELEQEATALLNGPLFNYDSPANLRKALACNAEEAIAAFRNSNRNHPITDLESDMSWWLDKIMKNNSEGEALGMNHPQISEPVVREAAKVGRNDPCPCGSGKKFKKCCGA